jgi:copper chaperone
MATIHAILNVPSISCDHCKRAIEGAVGALDGVAQVTVDVGEKTVTIDLDPGSVGLDAVEAAIGAEGYEVAGRHVFEA